MRYQFVEDHRTVWPIVVQCDVLQVSRGGYYAWRKRGISGRAQRRAELTERIREIHAVKYQDAYGAVRVHRELVAQGHACNRKTVAECMKQAGIRAKTVRKFRVCTTDSSHPHPVAPNVVDRNFTPSRRIPQTSLFQLLLRHFQALPTPQTIHPLDVHRKSLVSKESTDLTITEPGKLPDQFQHPLHQRRVAASGLRGVESVRQDRERSRLVVRYAYHVDLFLGMAQLACLFTILQRF